MGGEKEICCPVSVIVFLTSWTREKVRGKERHVKELFHVYSVLGKCVADAKNLPQCYLF